MDTKDLGKMMEKYRPVLDKLGKDMGAAAKKGEENIVKISKSLKIQLDMLGLALQKERLYYEIGKEVAKMLIEGEVQVPGLDKYKKSLEKMRREDEKRQRAMVRISSGKKGRKSSAGQEQKK
ncbi:MAG: hypothetical protein PHT95_00865 [Candidatus Omnitrophica bacterium]|nr:hypothetical protein [Candidatus Omnitrophota bacterium]MDD4012928.1 hypothetical protein [Candidatus Omnitrophota bacterium]